MNTETTFRKFFSLFSFCAVAILGACVTSNTSTVVDHDRRFNFSKLETFTWISDHPLTQRPDTAAVAKPILELRIQRAVLDALNARGFKFVEIETPADFVVSFSVSTRKEMRLESYPISYRQNWRWGYQTIGDSVDLRSTTKGALSLDIFDGKTKSLIWHGRANKKLSRSDQNLSSSIISNAVEELIKDFPLYSQYFFNSRGDKS